MPAHPSFHLFVAGAAGYLGRSVLRAARGMSTEVTGLVRSREQRDQLVEAGHRAVIGDLLDPSTYASVLAGCDAVLHLAQSSAGSLEELRRVRVEGGRRLIAAAAKAGVPRVVVGSGYWVYDSSPGVLVESSPLRPLHLSRVNFEVEEVAREARRRGRIGSVVVARPGMVYGPGSWLEEWVKQLREGSFRFVGDGSNLMSPVHWTDVGSALLLLAERGKDGESYLVVDDAPVSVRDFAWSVASQLGYRMPQGIPFETAREEWGEELALLNSANRGASNAKIKTLGWQPSHPDHRTGLPPILRALDRSS